MSINFSKDFRLGYGGKVIQTDHIPVSSDDIGLRKGCESKGEDGANREWMAERRNRSGLGWVRRIGSNSDRFVRRS